MAAINYPKHPERDSYIVNPWTDAFGKKWNYVAPRWRPYVAETVLDADELAAILGYVPADANNIYPRVIRISGDIAYLGTEIDSCYAVSVESVNGRVSYSGQGISAGYSDGSLLDPRAGWFLSAGAVLLSYYSSSDAILITDIPTGEWNEITNPDAWQINVVGYAGTPVIESADTAFAEGVHAAGGVMVYDLGNSASKNVGTGANEVSAGDHNHTGVYQDASASLSSAQAAATLSIRALGTGSTDAMPGDYGGVTGRAVLNSATAPAAAANLETQRFKINSIYNECYSTALGATHMICAAISSGTITVNGNISPTANHPGIFSLKDSTSAGGGAYFNSGLEATPWILLGGREKVTCVFQVHSKRATQTIRIGFGNKATQAAFTDGVFLELVGNSSGANTGAVATGKCTNAAGTTPTSDTYLCVPDTWYSAVVELNADATIATFTIYNEAGVSQWTNTVNANIPTAGGRLVNPIVMATESTSDAAAYMCSVDYVEFNCFRELIR